jgi:hypothetical protein
MSWEFPSTAPPEDQGTDMTSAAFQQPDARSYLVVRLITPTPATVVLAHWGTLCHSPTRERTL